MTTEPIPIKFTLACLYMGPGLDPQENPRTVKADRVPAGLPAVPLELAMDPKYVMDTIPAVRAMPLRPAQQEDYKSYMDRVPAMPLEPTVQKDPKYVMDAMPGVPAMSLKAVQEEDYESILDRVQAMPLEPTLQKDPKYVMDTIPVVPAMQMKSSQKEDYDSTVDIAMPLHPSHEKDPEYVMDAIPEVPAMPLKPSQQDDHESVVKVVPLVSFEKENPKLVLKKETLEVDVLQTVTVRFQYNLCLGHMNLKCLRKFFFSFHSFIWCSSSDIQYKFVIQHTHTKKEEAKTQKG